MIVTGTNQRYLPAAYYHPQGLNGRGWWRKWVSKAVGIVGNFIADKVQGILSPFGKDVGDAIRNLTGTIQEKLIADFKAGLNAPLEITAADIIPAEQAILDEWVTVNLKPFVENLIKDIKVARTLTDGNAKLTALNAIINKMAAVNAHYEAYSVPGITSAEAKEDVQILFAEIFAPIQMLVTEAVKEMGISADLVDVTFPMNSYSYAPLLNSSKIGTVKSQNYKVKAIGSTTNNGTTKVPGVKLPVIIKEPTKQTITNTADTPQTLPTNNGLPTTTVDNKEEPKAKDNTTLYVVGSIAAAAIVYAATRKPKAKATK